MCEVKIYDCKTNFSKYIDMLQKGEENEIVIYRYGQKVAVLTAYKEKKPRVGCGIGIMSEVKIDDIKKGFEDIPELFGY